MNAIDFVESEGIVKTVMALAIGIGPGDTKQKEEKDETKRDNKGETHDKTHTSQNSLSFR